MVLGCKLYIMIDTILKVNLKNIGKVIRQLRKNKGYTSYETFSFEYEIPRMQYWRMEKGQTNLTMKSLLRLLEIHDLTFVEFFTMVEDIDFG